MPIAINCYTESDNKEFFSEQHTTANFRQLPPPIYDRPVAKTGRPPRVVDNRKVRAWLLETGCLSYKQLVEEYPWCCDVMSGMSRLDAGGRGGLPVSKSFLFAALLSTDAVFSQNTESAYQHITGRTPSPRYMRHVNSVLQSTSEMMLKVLADRKDFEWWDYNDKALA